METLYVSAYLAKYNSPLAAYAAFIVDDSDQSGIDDHFIVALAGAETTYGTNIRVRQWGRYNAFSNGAHRVSNPYANFTQAIEDAIQLLTHDPRYTSFSSTQSIYSIYEQGDVNKTSPRQGTLDSIYGQQLGGDLSNVRIPRCTAGH
jgi:hypothetical protein